MYTTKHIKDIYFKGYWVITLHSGAVIECGISLADAINKASLYIHPQPELSKTVGILDPLLQGAA